MKTFTLLAIPHFAVIALPYQGWPLMITYIVLMFTVLKAATLIETKPHPDTNGFLYATAWVGMNYEEFNEKTESKPKFKAGFISLTIGIALTYFAMDQENPVFKAATVFTAMIFIFHFGLLDLNAQFLNKFNHNVKPIMNAPWKAKTLAEFWGKRWNMAFRDAAHKLIFIPLNRKLGPSKAAGAVFTFSGIVHEAVISVPARGGYGGPFTYFMLQFAAIGMQRKFQLLNDRYFTWLILTLPLPILFHQPFFMNVFIPLTETIGG